MNDTCFQVGRNVVRLKAFIRLRICADTAVPSPLSAHHQSRHTTRTTCRLATAEAAAAAVAAEVGFVAEPRTRFHPPRATVPLCGSGGGGGGVGIGRPATPAATHQGGGIGRRGSGGGRDDFFERALALGPTSSIITPPTPPRYLLHHAAPRHLTTVP